MRNRFEILQALESIFLKIQNKITKLNPGSVLYSLFYSVSSEIESVYSELDTLKTNSYISTATDEYLDNLIFGFSKLERIEGRRAFGYVVLEVIDAVIDTTDKINSLKISFPYYDILNDSITLYQGISSLTVPNKTGTFNYYIIPPISFLTTFNNLQFFENNSLTQRQYIVDYFISVLRQKFLQNTGKKLTHIVLPIVSEETGKDKNLDLFSINTIISFGNTKFKVTNNYEYRLEENDLIVDVDGIGKTEGSLYILKENAIIGGGTDKETDDEYRSRFYLYLNSLSKGTTPAIEEKVKEVLGNVQYKIIKTSYPGIINLYLDSKKPISAPFVSIISNKLEEVKPAGTQINVLLPKTIYINVLSDFSLQSKLDESLLNSLKTFISDKIIDSLEIGKPLLKSNLEEIFVSIKSENFTINDYQNVYVGYSLTQELFSLYKRNYFELLKVLFYDKQNPVLPTTGFFNYLANKYSLGASPTELQLFNVFSYEDLLYILYNGYISMYNLTLHTSNRFVSFIDTNFSVTGSSFKIKHAPRFSLEFFIEKIKNGEATLTTKVFPTRNTEALLNETIKDFCKNIDDSMCLRNIAKTINSSTTIASNSPSASAIQRLKYSINEEYANNRIIAISLEDIKNQSSVLYQYYLIKFLTVPISSGNDIELCDSFNLTDYCSSGSIINQFDLKLFFFFLNDIKYYKLIDVDVLPLRENEVIRIYSSSLIDNINNKYFIGINSRI